MSKDSKAVPPQPSPDIEHDPIAKRDAALARAKVGFPKTGHLMGAFLDAYQRSESITMAAQEVGVSRQITSIWKRDPDFMACFTQAHLAAQNTNNDLMRKTAVQLCTIGSPRFLIKNGQHVLDAKGRRVIAYYDYFPNLIAFMLKNRLPDEFKDKFEHEINSQLVSTLVSEFISIVKRIATPELSEKIQKELETMSAKMSAST